jgi:thioredoxin
MATVDLDRAGFESTVNKDNSIVIVDFWAAWCGPCQQFAPIYGRVSEKHPDITFAKVDTDANQELSAMAGIRSIPTLMAFRDGVLLFNQSGALPEPALEDLIAQVRAVDMVQVRAEIAAHAATSEELSP